MPRTASSPTLALGVIGLGNMGSVHCRNLLAGSAPRIRLAAVCDNALDLRPYAEKGLPCFGDSAALIRSGLVDAVLIATPHYDHTTIGIDAFRNGLHVLTEKPISVHKADAQRLIDAWRAACGRAGAAAAHKPVFAAMFQLRGDPPYRKLRELIQSGQLGELRRVNWICTSAFRSHAYYNSGGWRATWGGEGGGVLLNQCPHNLDLFQWLFGMPERVHAFCQFGRYHEIEVEDDVTATLSYPDGRSAVFIASTGETPGTNRLEITAENGRVVLEDGQLRWLRLEEPMSAFSRSTPYPFPLVHPWRVEIPVQGVGEQHIGILKNFAEAVLEGAPLIAPGEEGIRSVELGNAMLLSAFLGRTVELPMDGAQYEALLREKIAASTFCKPAAAQPAGAVDMGASFRSVGG